jgi:hypothetical protein
MSILGLIFGRRRNYRIVTISRDEHLYEEDDKKVVVIIEGVSGNPYVEAVVHTSSLLHWLPPYENELISTEKRAEIIERVTNELRIKHNAFIVD